MLRFSHYKINNDVFEHILSMLVTKDDICSISALKKFKNNLTRVSTRSVIGGIYCDNTTIIGIPRLPDSDPTILIIQLSEQKILPLVAEAPLRNGCWGYNGSVSSSDSVVSSFSDIHSSD